VSRSLEEYERQSSEQVKQTAEESLIAFDEQQVPVCLPVCLSDWLAACLIVSLFVYNIVMIPLML
jgi:hypothetical protein